MRAFTARREARCKGRPAHSASLVRSARLAHPQPSPAPRARIRARNSKPTASLAQQATSAKREPRTTTAQARACLAAVQPATDAPRALAPATSTRASPVHSCPSLALRAASTARLATTVTAARWLCSRTQAASRRSAMLATTVVAAAQRPRRPVALAAAARLASTARKAQLSRRRVRPARPAQPEGWVRRMPRARQATTARRRRRRRRH